MARTIHIWCKRGILGREITKYAVIHGAYAQFWPTLYTHKDLVADCRNETEGVCEGLRQRKWDAGHSDAWG